MIPPQQKRREATTKKVDSCWLKFIVVEFYADFEALQHFENGKSALFVAKKHSD